jgi:transposase
VAVTYHRSPAAKQFGISTEGRLRLFFLPPYSPEVNLDEQAWNALNTQGEGRAGLRSEELKRMLTAALFDLQKLPRRINNFFGNPDPRFAPD